MPSAPPPLGPVRISLSGIEAGLWASNGYKLAADQFTYSVPTASSQWPGYAAGKEPTTGYVPFTAQQASRFVAAMQLWSSYIAPQFTETDDATNPGDVRIAFTDMSGDSTKAKTEAYTYVGDFAGDPDPQSGDIWFNSAAADPSTTTFSQGDYSWESLLHEIGHALGLKHPFEDTVIQSPYDNRLYTIMSYTDAPNSDFVHFTQDTKQVTATTRTVNPATPMVLDIAAVQALYGANPNTNVGDTVYHASDLVGTRDNPFLSTIYDAGGNDTIDISGAIGASTVDLRPGAYSSIGTWSVADQEAYWISRIGSWATDFIDKQFSDTSYTWTNNLAIAQNTIIENVTGNNDGDILIGNDVANTIHGGYGNDVITGGLGADMLYGGGGSDIFRDTLAGFSGDRIVDFSILDTIDITDATLSTPITYLNGVIQVGGISFTVTYAPFQTIAVSADPTGGLDIREAPLEGAAFDFDEDRHSDILWRNANGSISTWQVGGTSGGDQVTQNSYFASIDPSWHPAAVIDVSGDERADIVWRNDNGLVSIWLAQAPSGFQQGVYTTAVSTDWSIAAAGDFTGDGRGDLLWRNSSGALSMWTSIGAEFAEDSYSHAPIDPNWVIEGAGDFNGDGRADILWRNTDGSVSIWDSTGTGFQENSYFHAPVDRSWHVAGIGDFNGDGKADILWRNDNGAVTAWTSNGTGFNEVQFNASAPTDWQVAEIGDFNGDGKADILWRNTSGAISIWHSTGSSFVQNTYFDSSVGTSWAIQAPHPAL